ncbi:MAG: DUF4248 domain-containing protein [Tannerellaceae bacterium]|nr:DUF4248 domain-containing protein [Tannerellaceae bacterium]
MKPFTIKTYGLQELALCYFPHSAPGSASGQLKRWLTHNPALHQELTQAGYQKGQHLFTPRQVETIIRHLGPP